MAPQIDLSVVRSTLGYEMEQFDALPRPGQMTGDYAEAMQAAWRCLRRQGIVQLLSDANRSAFFSALERASLLRRTLLIATRERQDEDEFAGPCHLADIGPFCDALASGQLATAADIAHSSRAAFNRRYEYEEDYHYAQCLFGLLQGADERSLAALLKAFETSVDGENPARLRACVALSERDGGAFEAALDGLVEEHEAYYARMKDDIVCDVEGFATEKYVLVEGLALKVLAVERGLSPLPEHRFMPADAYLRAPSQS